ncbi:uncharacterized protein LOC111115025 [Crassostrea virginica]
MGDMIQPCLTPEFTVNQSVSLLLSGDASHIKKLALLNKDSYRDPVVLRSHRHIATASFTNGGSRVTPEGNHRPAAKPCEQNNCGVALSEEKNSEESSEQNTGGLALSEEKPIEGSCEQNKPGVALSEEKPSEEPCEQNNCGVALSEEKNSEEPCEQNKGGVALSEENPIEEPCEQKKCGVALSEENPIEEPNEQNKHEVALFQENPSEEQLQTCSSPLQGFIKCLRSNQAAGNVLLCLKLSLFS